MNRWDGGKRDSLLKRGIENIRRTRSAERDEKRDPHKIPTPFILESPHTHQDPKTALTAPAIFLTCATKKENGVSGDLMGIKIEEKKEKRETNR